MEEKVNHPQHYGGDTTYEAIKVIEAWGLGFCLGNAVKYICRAGKKGSRLEDLEKARWYLDREIGQLAYRESMCDKGSHNWECLDGPLHRCITCGKEEMLK